MGIAERRKREKEIQTRKRRKEIMDAARRLFRTKGFAAATMEDIAREAELSPAALYIYFKNKDELYASLSFNLLEYLSESLEHACLDGLNAEQRFERLKEALYSAYKFDPLVLLNLFHLQVSGQFKNLSPEILSELNRISAKVLGIFVKFFEGGIRDGLFQDHHKVALADLAWSLFTGLVIWEESKKTFNPEKDYLKSTMDLAFEVLRSGIEKTKP